jgi:hypothetical protein
MLVIPAPWEAKKDLVFVASSNKVSETVCGSSGGVHA